MKIVEFDSVGTIIDEETLIIYPLDIFSMPDLDSGVHIDDADDEWFIMLSMEDRLKLVGVLISTISSVSATMFKVVTDKLNKGVNNE